MDLRPSGIAAPEHRPGGRADYIQIDERLTHTLFDSGAGGPAFIPLRLRAFALNPSSSRALRKPAGLRYN